MSGGGPLAGVRVVEFAGLGPVPFACMLLSDMGAEVLRIDRPDAADRPGDILNRGRASLVVNLKNDAERARLRNVISAADVLIEGFRPGVMERLGLGPADLCGPNPRLVYARMTGWGQDGPLAQRAGHDINYIALAGALAPIGAPGQPPVPPLNLVGDFGGGAMFAALGIVSALYERQRSGRGQVIDAAMVDGAASLLAMYLSHQQGSRGGTGLAQGAYFLDGSAPFYRCYECADGLFVAVGAIESKFWQILTGTIGLSETPSQQPATWDETSRRLEAIFRTRPRDEWAELFRDLDACVTPVLRPDDLISDPQLAARETYVHEHDLRQPAPAPRFSRTAAAIGGPPSRVGVGGESLAAAWMSQRVPTVAAEREPG